MKAKEFGTLTRIDDLRVQTNRVNIHLSAVDIANAYRVYGKDELDEYDKTQFKYLAALIRAEVPYFATWVDDPPGEPLFFVLGPAEIITLYNFEEDCEDYPADSFSQLAIDTLFEFGLIDAHPMDETYIFLTDMGEKLQKLLTPELVREKGFQFTDIVGNWVDGPTWTSKHYKREFQSLITYGKK